jgi:hypothetical protein
VRWPAHFHPTNIPLGALSRGYLRRLSGFGSMVVSLNPD